MTLSDRRPHYFLEGRSGCLLSLGRARLLVFGSRVVAVAASGLKIFAAARAPLALFESARIAGRAPRLCRWVSVPDIDQEGYACPEAPRILQQ